MCSNINTGINTRIFKALGFRDDRRKSLMCVLLYAGVDARTPGAFAAELSAELVEDGSVARDRGEAAAGDGRRAGARHATEAGARRQGRAPALAHGKARRGRAEARASITSTSTYYSRIALYCIVSYCTSVHSVLFTHTRNSFSQVS